MMVGHCPEAFEATGTAGRINQPAANQQANVAQQRAIVPAAANANANADGGQDGTAAARSRRSAPKLRGWDRPSVKDLDFAIRLNNRPDGYTESQRLKDTALLSAALMAARRGEEDGATGDVIKDQIAKARKSTDSYRRLWPTRRTRKEYALRHPPCGDSKPTIRTVDDEFIVRTRHEPKVASYNNADSNGDDGYNDEDSDAVLPLDRVPFHRPDMNERELSRELIRDFMQGVSGNYVALSQKVHLLKGKVALYWLKGISLTGLSWADLDDNSVDIQPDLAKSPKRKKRKANPDGS
jgi:hypothetical protein